MGFDELYGNEPVKKSLKKTLETGHVSNSYVFEVQIFLPRRWSARVNSRKTGPAALAPPV